MGINHSLNGMILQAVVDFFWSPEDRTSPQNSVVFAGSFEDEVIFSGWWWHGDSGHGKRGLINF